MASELLKEGYKATDVARALRISRSNCYSRRQSTNVKQCERADDSIFWSALNLSLLSILFGASEGYGLGSNIGTDI